MTDVPDWAKDDHTGVPDWAQEEKPAASAKPFAGEPDMGAAASAWQGAKQGATFNMSDELAGAHAAGPEWAGKVPYAGPMLRTAIGAGKYLAGDEAAKTAYEKARDEERHANKLAEEQHPYWHGAGEVAGSIPAMAVLPEGALAEGAGLGARALQAAKVGAEYAGLSGAGEGETPTERLVNTAVGGASGFVGGAAAPVLGAAVQKVVSPLSSVVRGWFDSEGVSMQRVANALLKDNELIESGKVKGLTAEQWQQAIDRGDPVTIADLGGPHTQSLLRSAANTSPAARGVLENTFNGDRYETQAARVSQDIRDLISGGANAGKTRDQLIADYEHEASPRYIKSFEEGDRQILTPPMMGLMNNSPMFKKAMNDAVTSGADRAALMGINPAKPGAINLQYWDAVKKELDDVASSAFRAGDKNRGSIAAKMAERLRTELDNEVPSYKDTRGVAETFFKSKNALEAGEKAATQQNLSLDKLGQIMRKMSPAEADLFREGWASKWSDAILNTPNRRDPTAKILQSDNARARALKVFGEDGVNFIQARLDLEKIMDFQRKALGNSSTARQLIEAGLAGGAAGAVGEYFGGNEGGISGLVAGAASHRLPFAVHGTLAKGLTTGVRTVAGYVDRKVAAKVADLLVSQDMDKVREGVRMLSHTPQLRQNFNKLVRNISTSNAISSSPRLYLGRAPALTGPVPGVAGEEKPQGKALGGQVPDQDARHKAHGGSVTGRARAEKALPKDHQLGMRVPKGGSSCSSCHFLTSAMECGNRGFQTWNGSAKLPAPKDRYCCDLWEGKTKRAAGGAVNRALRAAKGYATGGSPFDDPDTAAMMPETFVPPGLKAWTEQAAPKDLGIIKDIGSGVLNTLAYPGKVYQSPRPVSTEEMVGPAADMAMTVAGGASPFAQPGSAGVFGGRLAKTADLAALRKAEEMSAAGHFPDEIHQATGWWQGPDKKWRFEIPDAGSAFKGAIGDGASLGDVFKHDPLYEAYPQMRDIDLMPGKGLASGSYMGNFGEKGISPAIALRESAKDPRSVLLHEIQHGIQDIEGFAPGTNNYMLRPKTPAWDIYKERLAAMSKPLDRETYSKVAGYGDELAPMKDYKAYLKIVKNPSPVAIKAAQEYAAQSAYKRSAGEVESRAVEARKDFTPEQIRDIPPEFSHDIPADRRIINARPEEMQANETGPVWRSAVEDTIASSPMKAAPAEQWAGTLKNAKGIKPEEMDWLGLNDFLASKNRPGANRPEMVTKQELLDHLAGNRLELKDVVKGGSPYKKFEQLDENELGELKTRFENDFGRPPNDTSLRAFYENGLAETVPNISGTKFSSYQLPGGENYREHLLTMPQKQPLTGIQWQKTPDRWSSKIDGMDAWVEKSDDGWRGGLEGTEYTGTHKSAEDAAAELDQRLKTELGFDTPGQHAGYTGEYKSPHWDEPNVLAHVRSNDRMMESPEGPKKTLHLEEVQSDWHQKGRKHGYVSDIPPEGSNIPYGDKNYSVPNAPFKDTDAWAGLAMKRMIRHAAENGYDRISWTPGEAQAARYDLSKQVKKVHYDPDLQGGTLAAEGHDGRTVLDKQGVKPEQLEEYIGKDVAKKLLETERNRDGIHSLEGLDLKVGGEGMREFYDKMLPKIAEKIGKAHGVKVRQSEVRTAKWKVQENPDVEGEFEVVDQNGRVRYGTTEKEDAQRYIDDQKKLDEKSNHYSLHYFDITPSLKQQALKGMPMFQRGGRVKARPNHAAAKGLEVARQYKRGSA